MGNVSASLLFRSTMTQPLDKIMISKSPVGFNELLTAKAGTANLMPGLLGYVSATPNTITEAGAVRGNTSQNVALFVVEFYNESVTVLRNGSELTTAFANGGTIKVWKLEIGDILWVKGSSLSVSFGDVVVPAASGLVAAVGDIDGSAIDEKCHEMMALADLSNGTWLPVEYLGLGAHDKTA